MIFVKIYIFMGLFLGLLITHQMPKANVQEHQVTEKKRSYSKLSKPILKKVKVEPLEVAEGEVQLWLLDASESKHKGSAAL